MLHLNDHLYLKPCVFLWVANIRGLTVGFVRLLILLRGFHCWTHMYNKKYRGFHPRGYLSLLSITRHIFSFSCIQPCDPVGRYPTVLSPSNQTSNVVLIITMHSHPFHAMSLYICNAMCHFMPITCHIYDECYMDNSNYAYHPCIMDNYINQDQISKRSHISCQYICTHIY